MKRGTVTNDRWKELMALMDRLPPPTPKELAWQAIEFAYGNLACSTNHKPRYKAFKEAAMPTLTRHGVTEAEYREWAKTKKWYGG